MPTQHQAIDAIDALGGFFKHIQALKSRLVKSGFDVPNAAKSVEAVLLSGVLVMDSIGNINKA